MLVSASLLPLKLLILTIPWCVSLVLCRARVLVGRNMLVLSVVLTVRLLVAGPIRLSPSVMRSPPRNGRVSPSRPYVRRSVLIVLLADRGWQ